MKAIVLTFDKYKIFTDHMILKYLELWPDNNFIFLLPYQDPAVKVYFEEKYGDKVKLIKSPSGIVETIDALLKGFDDNDWVYWCMDDRYPIKLNTVEIKKIEKWISSPDSEDISGIMYTNSPWGRLPENLYYRKYKMKTSENQSFLRRKGYRMIWIHQFMKVKVLRTLFDNFRVNMNMAKEMDYILLTLKLPDDQRLYVLNKNVGIFGESTSRGKLTLNCAESLTKTSLNIPNNLEIGEKTILQGNTTIYHDTAFFIKDRIKRIIGTKVEI